ncbi:MAG: damage-inducible protein DinB [Bacteroidetes bacterium]|nr:DinB family protein [Bacteroidia bacterium]PCH66733.1 MAG: damage-inducible protein DinB [Bacteroidota bacterium]
MTNKWTNRIDEITNSFNNEFEGLSVEQLNWKASEKVWSIAQNIEHLIVINETYYPTMKTIREGNFNIPIIGKIGFIVNLLGNFILKSVHPDRRKKMKTFPIWEPSKSEISADILERFVSHQSKLKELIQNSEDLLAKGTIISSPANKNIVYKLETAFDIIVTHEQRHFEQAKEVLMNQKEIPVHNNN